MDTTLALALYGAILSTILGFWELAKERRRITIFLQYNEFSGTYSIIITNIGHRPVTLLDLSMALSIDGQRVGEGVPQNALFGPDKPFLVTLTDGRHLEIRIPSGISGEMHDDKRKARIALRDAENRIYTKYKVISFEEKFGTTRDKVY
jgi:hypothetical protein